MNNQTVFLGVDGGGSKTRAVAVDAQGQEVGRGTAGSSNYRAVGIEIASHELLKAIHAAVPDNVRVKEAFIGLAGVDVAFDHAAWRPLIAPIATQVHLSNDAELLLSAFPTGNAIALIAGTGSIAYARTADGKALRSGGWGHILGDEGSGYDLGIRALRSVMKSMDGRCEPTLLLDIVLRHWQLHNIDELVDFIYGNTCTKAEIASIAEFVFVAAAQNDGAAESIVADTVSELAANIIALIKRGHLVDHVSLAFGGSLLLQQPHLRNSILATIQPYTAITAIELVQDAALSAARAAANALTSL